jgi:hypothetical protein
VRPVVKRRGIRFTVLTIGALVAAGSMLVVPFLPEPAATSTAKSILGLDFYPTAVLLIGLPDLQAAQRVPLTQLDQK